MSNHALAEDESAEERSSRAWGEGDGGESRSVVFCEGLRLQEAQIVMFYDC